MLNMLIWFAVVLVLFAVGDLIAKLTHARISSVFATLMLFLILFGLGLLRKKSFLFLTLLWCGLFLTLWFDFSFFLGHDLVE